MSNAKTRQALKQGGPQIPELAKKLGVKIITMNVYGPDHVILAVVEAADIEAVRNFIVETRLMQWNTITVNATWSFEDAMARVEKVPTIF
jgi:hypothetical protein